MISDTLDRFMDGQSGVYETALEEIHAGRKSSHWMWFIFPQLRGLGHSPMAQHYGISSLEEARAYLHHPILGARYRTCVDALHALANSDAVAVFGSVDAMKLRSSLTLFEAAEPLATIDRALQKFFQGERDSATQRLLAAFDKATD